jgi:hypothetical protein
MVILSRLRYDLHEIDTDQALFLARTLMEAHHADAHDGSLDGLAVSPFRNREPIAGPGTDKRGGGEGPYPLRPARGEVRVSPSTGRQGQCPRFHHAAGDHRRAVKRAPEPGVPLRPLPAKDEGNRRRAGGTEGVQIPDDVAPRIIPDNGRGPEVPPGSRPAAPGEPGSHKVQRAARKARRRTLL